MKSFKTLIILTGACGCLPYFHFIVIFFKIGVLYFKFIYELSIFVPLRAHATLG